MVSSAVDESGTELRLIALAAVVWAGADVALEVSHPRWVAVLGAFVALGSLVGRRRSVLLVAAGLFVVASHLGVRADAAYSQVESGVVSEIMTAVGDPRPQGAGVEIDLRRASGERLQALAYGQPAGQLARLRVGQAVHLDGRLRPVGDQPWLRTRHIVGRLSVAEALPADDASWWASSIYWAPNAVSDAISSGADTLAPRRQALYLGLVIGDDRLQPLGQQLQFKAAGLTHLLAVSGQNVAFALVAAKPLLSLLGYRARFVGLIAVLVLFAIVTRLEPSVLRATTTAAITGWAALSGRERTGLSVLSLAVMILIAIDPFLVDAVAFQLSVAASGAILLFGPVAERMLPGPSWLSAPMAVTIAAQLGVSPLLMAYFGPIPLASIPANLLVGWAAAVVMTLGLTVGVVASVMPSGVAVVLQTPAEILLWWIETVAALSTTLPLPRFGAVELAVVLALLALVRTAGGVWMKSVLLAVTVGVGFISVPVAPQHPSRCGTGIVWYPAGAEPDAVSVLLVSPDAWDRSVEDCMNAGIRSVDVVVVERGSATSARLVTALTDVVRARIVLAPPQHRVIGARRLLEPAEVYVAGATISLTPSPDRVELLVSVNAGPDG